MSSEVNETVGDPSAWLTISVAGGEMPIGRASAKHADRTAKHSNMFFVNSHLSKTHARLLFEKNVIYLEDSGSTFGTVWNNNLLVPHEKVTVKQGDRIGFVLNRPSNLIKELTRKASDKKMIALESLLNPSVQLLFLIETIDLEEGSLVFSLLKGDNCLANLRREKKALDHSIPFSKVTTEELEVKSLQAENTSRSPSPVTLHVMDSDESPDEELYEREFCNKAASLTPSQELIIDVSTSISEDKEKENRRHGSDRLINSEPQAVLSQVANKGLDSELVDLCDSSDDTNIAKVSARNNPEDELNESQISDAIDDTESLQETETGMFCKSDNLLRRCQFPAFTVVPVMKISPIPPMSVFSLSSGSKEEVLNDKHIIEEDDFEDKLQVAPLGDYPGVNMKDKSVLEINSNSHKRNEDIKIVLDDVNGASKHCLYSRLWAENGNLASCDSSDEDYECVEDNQSESISDYENYDGDECSSYISRDSNSFFNPVEDLDDPWNVSNYTSDENDYEEKVPSIGDITDKAFLGKREGWPYMGSEADLIAIGMRLVPDETKSHSIESRKRSRDPMEEQDTQQTPESEHQAPKKARTRSFAREIGKGLMYVTGTLVALVAYGGYLEKNGAQ